MSTTSSRGRHASCLRTLIDDADLRRRMGRDAWEYAQTRSIDVCAHRWLDVYQKAAPDLCL